MQDSIKKNILLALATSILLILSFPLPNFWPVAWIALVPLLFAVEKTKAEKEAFFLGWASGFVFYVVSIAWLRHVTYFGWFFASAVEGFYIGVFAWLAKIIFTKIGTATVFCGARHQKKRSLSLFLPFLLAAFWVALEWFRTEVPPLQFGWNLLAYSQSSNLYIIQLARILGAYGVSFLVAFVNVVVYVAFKFLPTATKSIRKDKDLKKILPFFILPLCTIGLILAIGVYSHIVIKRPLKGPILRATVIQGNIAQEDKWKPDLKEAIVDVHLKLTELASYDNTDLIIWPEAAYPGYLMEEKEGLRVLNAARKVRRPLLVGSIYRDEGKYYNSAFLISEQGFAARRYDKRNLVPFGEYIPLGSALTFLKPFASSLGVGDFSRGKNWMIFHLPLGAPYGDDVPAFSVLICFEDAFPYLARHFVEKGARFLIVITNDAWFKNGGETYQHLQPSVFRAVENDVFVVRAANTGISCFVSPKGKVISRVCDDTGRDTLISGRLTDTVYFGNRPTFYQKYGYLFPYVCVSVLALFLLLVSFPRLMGIFRSKV